MTRRELSQVFYLKNEIEQEERRLAQLEICRAPESEISETRRVIKLKKEEAEIRQQQAMRYILDIPDVQLRQIFWLRHIDLLSWNAVAMRIGGDNTADGVRKAHDRYIQRTA
jgi:hypothetical protein